MCTELCQRICHNMFSHISSKRNKQSINLTLPSEWLQKYRTRWNYPSYANVYNEYQQSTMFHWYPQCLQVGLKNTSGIPEDPCLPSLHPGHPFLSLGVRATRALLLSAALRVWRRLCPLTHTSKSNLVVGATMKPLHNTYTGRTSPFQLCCVSAIGQHNLSASFSMLHKSNSGEDIRTR